MCRQLRYFAWGAAISTLAAIGTLLVGGCGGSDNGTAPPQPGNPGSNPFTTSPAGVTTILTSLMPAGQQNARFVGSQTCGQSGCHGSAPSRHVARMMIAQRAVAGGRQATSSTGGTGTTGGTTTGGGANLPILTIPAAQPNSGTQPNDVGNLDSKTFFDTWGQTAHARAGVGCESCHGPGGAHVDNPQADPHATIITFPNIVSARICGQCHTAHTNKDLSQFDQWFQSPHRPMVGSVLQSALASATPGSSVSTCFQCHNSLFKAVTVDRGINPSVAGTFTNPQLAAFASYAQQLTGFTTSTSAEGPSDALDPLGLVTTANCAVCHNPHSVTNNFTNTDGDDTQVRKSLFVPPGDPRLTKIAPGSTDVVNFDHNCGQCHNSRGSDPSDTSLAKGGAHAEMHEGPEFNMLVGMSGVESAGGPPSRTNTHAIAPQQCATCHMSAGASGQSTHTFTVTFDACVVCHTTSVPTQQLVDLQNEVTNHVVAIKSRLDQWGTANAQTLGLTVAAGNDPTTFEAWEYSGQGGPSQQSAIPIAIKRARYNYYFVLRDRSFGIHNPNYTRYLLNVADQNLDTAGAPAAAATGGNARSLKQVRGMLLQENMTRQMGSLFSGIANF